MGLRIENNYKNTLYYKQNKKATVPETSFENQLNKSQKKLSVDRSDTANLGLTINAAGYRISTNYSNERIEKRKERIHEIQKIYDENSQQCKSNEWRARLNPKIMENVADLNIEDNKNIYFDKNGKININKIAADCGISLSNATPLELQSLNEELEEEGMIDEKTYDAFDVFIDRACSDIALDMNGKYSFESEKYVYNNVRFDSFEKAIYFKKLDVSYNADQNIKNIDDIVLNLIN